MHPTPTLPWGRRCGALQGHSTVCSVTNCAERTAIFQGVAAGEKTFTALAVVAEGEIPVSPCGACRQVMAEFHVPRILMANLAGDTREMTLEALLPSAFGGAD